MPKTIESFVKTLESEGVDAGKGPPRRSRLMPESRQKKLLPKVKQQQIR